MIGLIILGSIVTIFELYVTFQIAKNKESLFMSLAHLFSFSLLMSICITFCVSAKHEPPKYEPVQETLYRLK